jgi:hypothetical protein
MDALGRVTAALEAHGSRKHGGNWNCPGPGHANGDRTPSLHVTSDSRGVAMKCFAGCDTRDIVAALGLGMDDLWEEPLREVERYPYRKEGRLYEKVRFASGGRKTFRWEPALNGHRMGLYRIEEALGLPDPVYLVESEKDVNTLLTMGVSATCMPGGAGDWRPEYTAALRGREIIIVADRDSAGIRHAEKVHADLKDKVISARIVQSATINDHDDVGDHLKAGHTLDQLVSYHSENSITSRYQRIDWIAAFKEEPEDITWLKEDFLEAGTLNCLFSKPGIGKSLLALEVSIEVIRNGKTVSYFDDENRRADIVDRLRSFGCTAEELSNFIVYNFQNLPPLDSERGGEHLDALMEQDKPDLVVMDTISRMIQGSENDADTYIQAYRCSLTRLKKRGIAVLRLDHTGKDSSRGQRGSSAKESDADVLWFLSREGDSTFTLECQKSRSGHIPYGTIISLLRQYDPLRHVWDVHIDIPLSRYESVMRQMDILGISPSLGRDKVRKVFADNGVVGVRNDQLQAAIIERRNRLRRLVPSRRDERDERSSARSEISLPLPTSVVDGIAI